MEESVAILPFGIDLPEVVAAYGKLPESCRSCSVVLEALAAVAVSQDRVESDLDSKGHAAFVAVDSAVVIRNTARCAEQVSCEGPVSDVDGPRPGCPSQWLVEGAGGRANYGVTNPAVFFELFISKRKPQFGFKGSQLESSES